MASSISSWAAQVAAFRLGHGPPPDQGLPPIEDHDDILNQKETRPNSNNLKTRFFGSQASDQEVIDYSYTDNPFRLMFWDVYYFFKYAKFLPNIVNPLLPCDSGDMCELALTKANFHCLFVHFILIVLQSGFLLIVPPVALLLPLWVTILFVASFFVVNQALCRILNGYGSKLVFTSDPGFALKNQAPFAHEKWFFLNGVAAGEHWLQSALNRLAITFGREVTGIHNRTSGIIFDTIECLIQRNFCYATPDIRAAYGQVKAALLCPQYARVVFILHSQGGIEGGMVLDWLLQELPQDLMGKLEVYTFGNAANHFNNPYTSAEALAAGEKGRPLVAAAAGEMAAAHGRSPTAEHNLTPVVVAAAPEDKGEVSLLSSFLHQEPPSPPKSPLFNMKPYQHQQHDRPADGQNRSSPITTPSHNVHAVARRGRPPTSSPSPTNRARVVHHIEHYAFTTDFVAAWGVLHFATAILANNTIPKFVGRLFARTDPAHRGGHQFVQHYLDGMFPLERDDDDLADRPFIGCRDRNDFMESEVLWDEHDPARREGLARCLDGCFEAEDVAPRGGDAVEVRNGEGEAAVVGLKTKRGFQLVGGKVKVKELSRLWHYRNGRVPPPKNPELATGGADGQFRAMVMA